MQNSKQTIRTTVLIILILLAAISRLIPHPANFAPIGALGLFGAAYFKQKHLAIIIPLISLFISDVIINNTVYAAYFDGFKLMYAGWYWTYGALVLCTLIGFISLKKVKVTNVLFSAVVTAVVFFVVSNFGVWMGGSLYPKNAAGLLACYVAAIPFLKGTLLGNLFYSTVLFGGFELMKAKWPVLQLPLQLQTQKLSRNDEI
ncbi:MAG: hypothetical protein LAT68_09330 [Cyclobacteriaceae bacterium]|nr:hypothetical protein [Cyclobacteriaceae bacterium]MCH8516515.1 hypothetical protein [Cyclobacteriaceae bacterium]